jgi:mono/diheme cytochrome c family protein
VKHVRWFPAPTMLVATLGMLLVGCGAPPGQPRPDSVTLAPNDVVEFDALYADNCAGCHGANGRGGAAIALANPVYLSIVDERSMRATIAGGVRGTSMPAFAQRAGGMLTEKQIDALADGVRSRWSRPAALSGANPPSYAATSAGDIHRGEAVYETFCQSCHGRDGRGGPVFANHRDRGTSRAGRSGLARIRRRASNVGSGSHRRGELARLASRRSTRTAVCPMTLS